MSASRESVALLALLLALGLWLGLRRRGAHRLERVAVFLLPALLGVLVATYWATIQLNTRWTWSACRLAPTIGLFHGYPLYSPEASGVINGWLYGPVAALVWAPAALAASPLPALTLAAFINQAFLLIPLLAAARLAASGRAPAAGLAFVFGATALLQIYATWYMASALNVDAVAVGLGAGACLLLLTDAPPSTSRLATAATLSVLAAWTKQTEAPLVLALAGWLWLRHGRRASLRYVVAAGIALLATGGLVALAFPWRDVVFNMWTVPAAHARPGGWVAAWHEITDFVRYTLVFWLPCAVALAVERFARPATATRGESISHPSWLMLAAALVLLPTGIMAAIKTGGDRNSLHSVYYLAVAATLALARLWPVSGDGRAQAVAGLILLLSASSGVMAVRQIAGYPQLSMLPTRCLSEEAWIHARENPGTTYFPWDPLATLMAEGRMLPFEYGVLDRIYADRPPSREAVRAEIPASVHTVAYPKAGHNRVVVRDYLSGFTQITETNDWVMHRRERPR